MAELIVGSIVYHPEYGKGEVKVHNPVSDKLKLLTVQWDGGMISVQKDHEVSETPLPSAWAYTEPVGDEGVFGGYRFRIWPDKRVETQWYDDATNEWAHVRHTTIHHQSRGTL